MSPKQPSKDKRAAQNRQQRAARAARTANANVTTRPATASSGGSGGGLLGRLRGTSAPRAVPGGRPSLSEARALQPPGLRAALSAVFAAVAAIVLCTFLLRYPVDAQGDVYSSPTIVADWVASGMDVAREQPDLSAEDLADEVEVWTPGRERETVVQALWPYSLAIVLPLVGTGIGLWAVRKRAGSKMVNRALYATLFGAILTRGLLLLFLPSVIAIGVAMFQVRKAEAMDAAEAAGDGEVALDDEDVIEVDEVTAPDDLDDED